MDLLIAFLLFIAFMAISLISGVSMLVPLCAGFVLFVLVAMRRGFSLKSILGFAGNSLSESLIVIRIMLLIGCLTGMWRLSGTVAYFVSLGTSVISPGFFLLAAFLLSSAMSFALGTSFGVTATAGVILISIARAGGADPVLTAGAILSGVYVGDRGSPAASSGNLVAVLTHTDMRRNVREMFNCALVPFLVSCLFYAFLSFFAPMQEINAAIPDMLRSEFTLHWSCIIPAIVMIVLPFCGVSIRLSMAVSLICSAAVALAVQKCGAAACVRAMLLGYTAANPHLSHMLSGGGMGSMLEVCGILLVSCSYGKIFEGAALLAPVNRRLVSLSERIGRFPVMLLLGIGVAAVFCNQTIGAIMQSNLSADLYGDSEEEKNRKMLDIENSVITIAGIVPWCIASSVPLTMLGAGVSSLPCAFYLWFVPLWWLIRSGRRTQYSDTIRS